MFRRKNLYIWYIPKTTRGPQEDVILMINTQIMEKLGLPKALAKSWFECHCTTTLTVPDMGIRVKTKFQRKSGDVSTFIGNTITSMACLAFVYDLKKAICGIFAGDDSLIHLLPHLTVSDKSELFAVQFNSKNRNISGMSNVLFSFLNTRR
eukprot:GHVR01143083.1.p1 GENE.GHVR01143083.1~~GHVR01143083.1.p1  ORF type:complete len:151 (-),score=4.01 GHVR01143083.1:607-1059(-)